ncbi:hypothetical protein OROGR_011494 [Orobanche gracilis]
MDKMASRSRGFAFLSYATEEESKKAIEGMHGKVITNPRKLRVELDLNQRRHIVNEFTAHPH